nr:MAG TPA: hypothetical protein [Caudoviricetes sp.]
MTKNERTLCRPCHFDAVCLSAHPRGRRFSRFP